jgi:DegV family protein with EDD domain
VPASIAFADRRFVDGELAPADFYARMRDTGETPLPSGVPERGFRQAFDLAIASTGEAICLVMPFDVVPSFTTASAAMLSLDEAGPAIKILNPGVASAGLCSLIASLGPQVAGGWMKADVLSAIDDLEPGCDTIFVPADLRWLEQAGRLRLIEERLGPLEDATPVLRVGTRISGISLESSHEGALRKAVALAGRRAGKAAPIVVTVDHADAPGLAARVAEMMNACWTVRRTIVTELSPTIGSQLGPGAVGIGVAPLSPEEEEGA